MGYRVQIRADKLRKYCDAIGWTVGDLAEVSGRNQTTIYRYISRGTQPSASFIAACAAIFGEQSLGELFYFYHDSEDAPQPSPQRKSFTPVLKRREIAHTVA